MYELYRENIFSFYIMFTFFSHLLDIIMFKAVQVYELLPLFIKVLKGEHLDSNKVLYFKTDYLKVECHEDIVTDIDGEKGPDFPLEIKCIKGGLKILGVK